MEEIKTPTEAKIDELTQLLAVLIDRLGGEVIISLEEFSMFEDVPVLGRNISSGYVRFALGDEDEESVSIPEHGDIPQNDL